MDAEQEQVSWLQENGVYMFLNIALGAVVFFVIWMCCKEPEKKQSRKKQSCEDDTKVEKPKPQATFKSTTSKEIVSETFVEAEIEPEVHAQPQEIDTYHLKEDELEFDIQAYSDDALKNIEDSIDAKGKKITYQIDVKTGSPFGSGTDANVFIILYGEDGNTDTIYLKKSTTHTDKFEQSHVDSFSVETADIGKLHKIRIGHDNKGLSSGWYLDQVVVTIPSTTHKWTFLADRWLDKKEGDGKIEIDILVKQDYHQDNSEKVSAEDAAILSELDSLVADYQETFNTSHKDAVEVEDSKTSNGELGVEETTEDITVQDLGEVHCAPEDDFGVLDGNNDKHIEEIKDTKICNEGTEGSKGSK